jgi:hypothetical protein
MYWYTFNSRSVQKCVFFSNVYIFNFCVSGLRDFQLYHLWDRSLPGVRRVLKHPRRAAVAPRLLGVAFKQKTYNLFFVFKLLILWYNTVDQTIICKYTHNDLYLSTVDWQQKSLDKAKGGVKIYGLLCRSVYICSLFR